MGVYSSEKEGDVVRGVSKVKGKNLYEAYYVDKKTVGRLLGKYLQIKMEGMKFDT